LNAEVDSVKKVEGEKRLAKMNALAEKAFGQKREVAEKNAD
jgi:hypothetical protein